MCDTVVALGCATADGATLFAKNSDREPNEAHQLLRIPAADHPAGSTVRCTLIEIPQVAHTHEVLLARPFWIWGAEMGANEHGLVIGNEAVFTRVPYDEGPGLLGMDLLRLALERARTAAEGLEVLTALLARHGQGGSHAFRRRFFYHNSFLLADPREAWVLETAGRHWAAIRVKDVRAISNGLTIGREWDLASPALVDHAIDQGWCKSRGDFDFARCYADRLYTRLSFCRERRDRAEALLAAQRGRITVESMCALLRDHGPAAGPSWTPAPGLATVTVCWHAGFGPLRASQSVGSLVSHLTPGGQTHFVTGTSAPCTSLFKPVWLGAPLPEMGPPPGGSYEESTLFWRHENLHRATLRDFSTRLERYRPERDRLEAGFVAQALRMAGEPAEARAALAARCFAEAGAAEERWLAEVAALPVAGRRSLLFELAWRGFDRAAAMPDRALPGASASGLPRTRT